MLTNIAFASTNIFLSLILGAAAFAFIGVQFPDVMNMILDGASTVESWLAQTGLPVRYNIWVKFLIDEQQLTFMFFVIVARIFIAMVLTGFKALFASA